ncbi:MAG TPA: hypothetical protein ENG45_01080, partial [Candidatus Aenigmarchaeota archaeon]|nr:hypothetical protein [Candidatus Aenigmarchaeota archaeon]
MRVFTTREILDLSISVIVVSIIFHFSKILEFKFAILVTLLSFFLHEFMHKVAAKKFSCTSVYKIY